ncbi:MAG: 50S ribosomal protein L30 [Clostridiales bacterium]|jgi:large subunit ribosomal protein L30|nr:50S ribosomal protein L30 [Clostridiales bacterium]
MAQLKITLKKSTIGCLKNQIDTVAALGLRKIGQFKIHEDNPVIRGMVFRVQHLVEVEELKQ